MQLVEISPRNRLIENGNLDRLPELVLGESQSFAPNGGGGDDYMATPHKIIRDREFAQRLARACDGNSNVPLHNHGRLTWVKEQLETRFHQKVSVESVRKWFGGEVKPRPDKLSALAQLLEVDEAWLSLGINPDLSPREVKARNATAEGAVNVLTGFIQIAGGNPAFPADNDQRARDAHIHLYSIIRGAQYAFHVALAREEDGQYRFTVPTTYQDLFVVGAIVNDGPGVTFVELSHEMIDQDALRRGGALELAMDKEDVQAHRIRSFGERL